MKSAHELPTEVCEEIKQLILCGRHHEAADLARENGATVLDPEFDV